MRGSTDVAVIGGGVLGSAIALHLAEAGLDVTLLERDGIGQATSAAGAGFVGMWAAGWTPTFGREHIPIERYGLDFYRALAEEEEFGYRQNGNLYVATSEATWDEQIAPKLLEPDAVPGLQRLSPGEVAAVTGIIPADAVYGGILHPDGAQVSAGAAARALSRRFVAAGGRLETRMPVARLHRQGDRVTGVEMPRGPLHAERVIVAAGAWTNALLATIDVRLPVVPLVAFRVVTEPLGVPATMPTIMIGEVPMYLREYDGALLWGMHYRAPPRFRFVEDAVPERFDQLPLDGLAEAEAKAATASGVFPSLAASRSKTVAFGAPTFTPDQRPCLGPVPDVGGLYVATGCNEAGVTHAPGYGRLFAELLTSGATELCSIDTFAPGSVRERVPRRAVCPQGSPAHASGDLVGRPAFRVAIGGIVHETNQFVAAPTTLEHFDVARGAEVFTAWMAEGHSCIGGMMAALGELGAEAVGTLYAVAEPWGTITADAYARLREGLLDEIQGLGRVDAVALDLHGAGVADGVDDIEGDLCRAVRDRIGPDVLLVATHDLHGHISDVEAEAVDALFPVHEYPHDDMYERGHEAIEWISRQLACRVPTTVHVERLPMVIPTTTTYRGVGRKALEVCLELEQESDVIDVAFMHGFPYTDNRHVGAQVVVTVEGDRARAREVAVQAARAIWDMRYRFPIEYLEPGRAIDQASHSAAFPVVINETSDNPGGGAPGDGTHLLRALLDAKPEGAVFCGIRDPDVVRQAQGEGVGATIAVSLGGKTDTLHGDPIQCSAYVKVLTDGETVLEAPTGRGWRYSLGHTALLLIDGIEVIVISRNVQTIDRTPLILHGIDPVCRRLIALKSSQHFRSGFEHLAAQIIPTDPPGLTTMQLERFSYMLAPRPIFPHDADAHYP